MPGKTVVAGILGANALTLAVLLAASCADSPRPGPPPPRSPSQPGCAGGSCIPLTGCADPAPGCPCDTEGAHLACGHVESQIGNQTVCGTGDSVCTQGFWGDCVISNTMPIGPPPSPSPPYQPEALGQPVKCLENPCDPSCWDFLDTPAGLTDKDAGLFADDAGVTLIAGGPPPAGYLKADFVRDYDASGLCAPGTGPVWEVWSWNTMTPADSSISFTVQTAATAAGLGAAPADALLMGKPPGQPAVAHKGPPNTLVGSAIVDTTLVSAGRIRNLPFLRVTSRLDPSSDGQSAPVLLAWDLQVGCAADE